MFEGNPFPGLRPFQFDENFLFFGREEQVSQLLQRLGDSRFLAVVGASGSGKSSLVRAGLLPELHGGTMTSASIAWELAIMRPGGDPLTNLAESLVESGLFGEENEENILQTRTTLSRSGLGLIEAYKQSSIDKGANLLLLVDQFEEIFRFRQSGNKASQEASHFIQLLLETARQSDVPVFIILTMRSDFLGDCAEFKGLAEAVNEGEYLIPRLNRKQRARAIEGPVKVGGAEISPRLKQQLLNDIGDDPDQLPILQHALMRMWDYWENNTDKNQALDLEHYDAIGRMVSALSRHADEVYRNLPDDEHRLLCMKLFKAITEKQADGRGIRRPLPFGEIDEITGHQRNKILTVIDAYRPAGRTFIMPGETVKIHDQVIIDISHESLMRVWIKLKQWVSEEADSTRIYTRLCETAELHNRSQAGFYRDPDLKIALSWRENNKPNANWGARINSSFDLAMRFLDESKEDFESEQRAKEEARKRELDQAKALAKSEKERAEIQRKSAKRNKVFAVFLFGLACLAVFMAFEANTAKKEAQNNLSYSVAENSDKMSMEKLPHKSLAFMAAENAKNKNVDYFSQKIKSTLDHNPFLKYEDNIFEMGAEVKVRWFLGTQVSVNDKYYAAAHDETDNSYFKIIDVEKRETIYESKIYKQIEGLRFSSDSNYLIVAAVGKAGNNIAEIINLNLGESIKQIETKNFVTGFAVGENLIAIGTNLGEVFIYNFEGAELSKYKLSSRVADIRISPKGNRIAIVENEEGSYFKMHQVWGGSLEIKNIYSTPKGELRMHKYCKYSSDGKYLVSYGGGFEQGNIEVFDAISGNKIWENFHTHYRLIVDASISPDSKLLATPSIDQTVRIWDLSNGKEVIQPLVHDGGPWHSLFSPDMMKLVTATDHNDIRVWDLNNGKLLNSPTNIGSDPGAVSFSQDGSLIRTLNKEGKIFEFKTKSPTVDPILLTHENQILDFDLNSNGNRLASASKDGEVKLWSLSPMKLLNSFNTSKEARLSVFVDDGKKLFIAEGEGMGNFLKWYMLDAETLNVLQKGDLPDFTNVIQVSLNSNYISFVNRYTFKFTVLEFKDGQYVTAFESEDHKGMVVNIQFSLNGENILTASHDGRARVFDVKSKKLKYDPLKYGFFFHSPMGFSPDGKMFATSTGIGVDAVRPIIWDAQTGKVLHELSHFSGVMDMMFTPDGEKLITGSRDKTSKIWNTKTGKIIRTLKVDDWASGVGINPHDSDQIFTFSRDRAIYAWSIKSGRYVDGPYQQPLIGDFFYSKIKSNPNLNYLVNVYSKNAVSLWPIGKINQFNDEDRNMINSYAKSESRIFQDESGALRILDQDKRNETQDKISFSAGNLSNWFKWRKEDYKEKMYPSGDLTRDWYVNFLITQNTKNSLEQALVLKPSNISIIEKYAIKLDELSDEDSINSEQLKKKASWYRSKLDVTPVSRE